MTMRASSTREAMLSLRKAWRRWCATVWVLMYMRAATWLLFSPSATRPATACSVSVRLSHPVTGRAAGVAPVAAADAELAQPPPDAGLVAVGADLAVSAERFLQAADRLIPVALAGVQDAEVFGGGGPGPRVGVLRGGLGQAGRVAAGQAPAVGRGRGQGREPRVGVRQGLGGAGGAGGQLAVARGQGGASQPGRQGGVAEQEPGPGLQVGAQLAEVAEGGGRAVARLGDLRLGHGGFGARVEVRELRAGGGTGGEVLGRGRDVAAAQLDHGQHAVRGRGVPVRAEGPGDGQSRPGRRRRPQPAGRRPGGCGRAGWTAPPGPGCPAAPGCPRRGGCPRPRRAGAGRPGRRRARAAAGHGGHRRRSRCRAAPHRAAAQARR